ncbi:MAG: hypothetical protein IJO52_03990 [Clostridia bacterium]|nr:hypothetical protein [Clostridia bacterium]
MKKALSALAIITLLIVLVASTVATTGYIQKELLYDNIKITLDGEEIKPTDVNGNYIEPFIIEGTTYLPVRGIANSLGLGVDWEDETRTVKLTTPAKTITPSADSAVIYDEGGVKVTYKGYGCENEYLLYVNFLVENESGKGIDVDGYYSSVNGYMVDGYLYESIPTGKKANVPLEIAVDELEYNDIAKIENIEFVLDICDTETYDGIMDNLITVTVTPEGVTTSPYTESETEYDSDMTDVETYNAFIDFIKEKGTLTDGEYAISTSHSEVNDKGQNVDVTASLAYDTELETIKLNLQASVIQNETPIKYMAELYLPHKSDKYDWIFFAETDGTVIEMSGTLDAYSELFDADALEVTDITPEFSMMEDLLKSTVAMLLDLISMLGDAIIAENGSSLSLSYFGL